MPIALLLIGLALGAAVAWIVGRAKLGTDVARLESALEHERSVGAENATVLVEARARLSTQVGSMCGEGLRGNNEQFIELAKAQFEQLQLGANHRLESRQKAVEN